MAIAVIREDHCDDV